MAFYYTLIRDIAAYLIVVPALLVVVAILGRRSLLSDAAAAAFGGACCVVLVKLAGALYTHPRPFVVEHSVPMLPHVADNAFPSDHLAACGLAVAFLWNRDRRLALLALGCAGLIGYARVAARLHWPIDVVVGFALGMAGMLLAAGLIGLLHRRQRSGFLGS